MYIDKKVITAFIIIIFFISATTGQLYINYMNQNLEEKNCNGEYKMIKKYYRLDLEEEEISSKIIIIGKPIKSCKFYMNYSENSEECWFSVGLINKGKYKYASFERRYGIDFRAMVFNKDQFLTKIKDRNNHLSSDVDLTEIQKRNDLTYSLFEINIESNSCKFYIDELLVAELNKNIPKGEDMYFHLQLSNLENCKPSKNHTFVEVRLLECN